MSNTPRTDECWEDGVCNILLHSRQLERELAEVTKQRDDLLKALEKLLVESAIAKVKGGAA